MKRLFLLSNSTSFGKGYLDHAFDEISVFLSGVRRLAFVPYALYNQAAYGAKVAERLKPLGIEVQTVTEDASAIRTVEGADAVFVGGGNTFRLLLKMQRARVLDPIRRRAMEGIPYMGASAGTVVAAPTIRTTNDMPIVEPAGLAALGLVPFQINCHYLDPDPASKHMGETRETRLREFLEENDVKVLGIREGAFLRVEGDRATLEGFSGARLFSRGAEPVELPTGADISNLCRA